MNKNEISILNFLTPKHSTLYLNDNSTIRQTLEKFDYYKFSVVPLINEEGKYITTISEGDILRYIKNDCNFDIKVAENERICKVEKYRAYKALNINTSINVVFTLLLDQNFVPVIDDRGMYIGIIKRKDILNYFVENK